MSLEHVFFLSQIIASIAVVASLIFVGYQIRENTLALQRNEHNSTMEQWTVIRQAIATHRDIAELMSVGLSGQRSLAAANGGAVTEISVFLRLSARMWTRC